MINHYHFAGGGCNENVRTMGFPVLIVNIEAAVPSVSQKQKETTDLTNKEMCKAFGDTVAELLAEPLASTLAAPQA